MKKIGVIGAGTMGTKIIEKFLENDYEVYVYDKVKEACQKVENKGAKTVKSLKELASKTNKILMVLPGPEQVKSVTKGEKGILSYCNSEHIIVDLSTVDPFTSQENYKLAKNNNAGYLDAPILGRPQKCGEWTLPVGGDKKVLEKINDDFKIIASNINHVGPSGHGNIIKVLNNMMFGAINSITTEIMALSKELGMSPKVLYETIADSGAASVSNLFLEIGPKIVERDFEPTVTVDIIHENLKLGIDMAKNIKFPLLVSEANQKLNEIAQAKGLGKEDSSSTVKVYEYLTNKES